ncbi:4-hydroxybenzoate polyprenyl transferase [Paraphysoderma sedebokerense]|nr:4-hydroxybenzoate polyprenyl transferase [Paraphysoderma sedebokerense]
MTITVFSMLTCLRPIVSKFPYNILPVKTHPYLNLMRISAPIGTYLLYLPCTWSILMSSYRYIDTPLLETLKMLSLFAIGSFIMRGAGCTINDMWDRNFDKKVERTKSRPLASDQISMFNALSFLGLQLTAGLGILLQLNWYSVFLGASSLGLVAAYPLMKRVTYWPQAFLGLTFNWGALLGWTAVAGHSDLEVMLPLYAAGLSWTLVYDTIYAHQDKQDDAIVGIKSTALLFAQQTKPIISLFSASTLSLLSLTGYMNDQTLPYYIGLCAAGIHMANSVRKVDLDNRESCNRTFDSMKWVGVLIGLGAAMDWALKKRQEEEQKKVVESA